MLNRLNTVEYSIFWHKILDRANGTNKKLQNPKRDPNAAVATVKSLKSSVETKRECFKWQGADKSGTKDSPVSMQCAAESSRFSRTVLEIQDAPMNLVNIYKDDLDQCLGTELIQFAKL